jgi:multicomponent Na+:H+ antiporter subunit D
LSGYASLGLIHDGLEHNPVAFGFALLAQVLTVAALGRAAYLGFYRRRSEPYEHLEPARTGMRVSFLVLAGACVAFGALAEIFVEHVASPAASSLLHPATYASAALSSGGTVPDLGVTFDFFDPKTLLLSAVEILIGLALLVFVLRSDRPARLLRPLRAVHTGSVNDYVAYSAIGLAIAAYVLLA